MEQAVKRGEVVTASSRAAPRPSLSPAAGNRVLLLDLHAEGIPHYFEGEVRAVHVYGKPLVMEAARRLVPSGDFVLASTDAGRAKWVESLANDLHVPAAVVLKRRLPDGSTEIASRAASVEGKDVIVYDDMIRTGGSLLHAAKAYRDAGARRLFALTQSSGDALEADPRERPLREARRDRQASGRLFGSRVEPTAFSRWVPTIPVPPYLCRQPENT
jgi:ribose-phosphate pyrophosphokinase